MDDMFFLNACEYGDTFNVMRFIAPSRRMSPCHNETFLTSILLNKGLRIACLHGWRNVVTLLSNLGANDWSNALYSASIGGHMDIVNLIIDESIHSLQPLRPPDILNWNWGLVGACREGHIPIIKFMISKGANDWNMALWEACWNGRTDIVLLLISLGANDFNRGAEGACVGGNMKIVEFMIQLGAVVPKIYKGITLGLKEFHKYNALKIHSKRFEVLNYIILRKVLPKNILDKLVIF
jgi:ankyrin repeat protein